MRTLALVACSGLLISCAAGWTEVSEDPWFLVSDGHWTPDSRVVEAMKAAVIMQRRSPTASG
jgi:hypothetical protein